jgi:hypothetical protein
MNDHDRTVHCTIVPISGGHIEYVRYDRAGKWYREDSGRRTLITLAEAVTAAAQTRPSVIWHEGKPGGTMFDAKVRKLRANRPTAETQP